MREAQSLGSLRAGLPPPRHVSLQAGRTSTSCQLGVTEMMRLLRLLLPFPQNRCVFAWNLHAGLRACRGKSGEVGSQKYESYSIFAVLRWITYE